MTSYKPYSLTAATLTVDRKQHEGTTVSLDRAAGSTVTLPAATGTGGIYTFVVGVTVTSNSDIIKVANSTDIMAGGYTQFQDAGSTANGWETGATDDTITFNGTTSGGIKGDKAILQDVAAGIWNVQIVGAATGTEVTCFSATV